METRGPSAETITGVEMEQIVIVCSGLASFELRARAPEQSGIDNLSIHLSVCPSVRLSVWSVLYLVLVLVVVIVIGLVLVLVLYTTQPK